MPGLSAFVNHGESLGDYNSRFGLAPFVRFKRPAVLTTANAVHVVIDNLRPTSPGSTQEGGNMQE